MGMFDDIRVNVNILPTDSIHKNIIEDNFCYFQSKSIDNLMQHYLISSNGTLWIEELERVERYNEPDNDDSYSIIGSKALYTKYWTIVDFNGIVNFYTNYKETSNNRSLWYEFNAYYEFGKLQNIIVISVPGPFIDAEIKDAFN